MDLDLPKKIVLGAIGVCVLLLLLSRMEEPPGTESASPAASPAPSAADE